LSAPTATARAAQRRSADRNAVLQAEPLRRAAAARDEGSAAPETGRVGHGSLRIANAARAPRTAYASDFQLRPKRAALLRRWHESPSNKPVPLDAGRSSRLLAWGWRNPVETRRLGVALLHRCVGGLTPHPHPLVRYVLATRYLPERQGASASRRALDRSARAEEPWARPA
jgi:hypothetical protein